jgi:hypothetical protein
VKPRDYTIDKTIQLLWKEGGRRREREREDKTFKNFKVLHI